jgi:uncharacterized repeat protein (TIGR01451 family)
MKSVKLTTIAFITVATLYAGFALTANAGSGGYGAYSTCQTVYGGGENCAQDTSFAINKLVQSPAKGGEFVENLTINDAKFAVGSQVNFKIVIKNTGKKALTNIKVEDTLPAEVTFVSGAGKYDEKTRIVTFTIEKLDPGKEAELFVSAKVNKAGICPVNTVHVVDSMRNTADDTASFCTENAVNPKDGGPVVQQTPPMKQTPQTGPELFSLAALLPASAFGVYLRRKAKIA